MNTAIVRIAFAALIGVSCTYTATPAPASSPSAAASPGPPLSLMDVDRLTGSVGRTAIEVCVYVDRPSVTLADEDVTRELDAALADMRSAARLGALNGAPMSAVRVCRATPFHLATGARDPSNRRPGEDFPVAPRVDRASAAREVLRVVITSEPRVEFIFGLLPQRRLAEEYICDTGACREVTTSLYLTPSALRDRATLLPLLGDALGAVPRAP